MRFMQFNPYPVLLATGALMFGTVVFVQAGPRAVVVTPNGVSDKSASKIADDVPDADVARHPDMRVASVESGPASLRGRSSLKD
jgi:hypothetical protein